MDEIIDTFIELVKIDSPSGHEEKVRNYLADRLSKMGLHPSVDKAGNMLLKIHGEGEPVLLSAHMDTVEPGCGIKPKRVDGIIKSDGTTILGADNKVAVAAILQVLTNLPKKHRPIEVVFSVREETDSGIDSFDFSKLRSKIGIAADRGSEIGSVVMSSPWIENLEIEVIGKIAHSGLPEDGINALTIASNAITDLKWGRVDEKTTANIGLIEGGTAMNSVPSRVTLTGEVRSFSKKLMDKQILKIEKTFKRIAKKHGGKVHFKREKYCAGYNLKPSNPALKQFAKSCKEYDIKVKYEKSFGGSDANSFIAHGIIVTNVGEGSKDPHTLKESVSVENLVKITKLLSTYVSM